MRRVKIFILTYKRPRELNLNLKSLFKSDFPEGVSVEIINNHSEFHLDDEFKDKVIVHHQTLRPDWSIGHPARDWNAAIVNGFVSLKNPACDQLVLCQDDSLWDKHWYEKLLEIHESYTFYQCGAGDQLISMTADAVKRIGLFDERFCFVGYHDGDYILRAYLYNGDKSSINDFHHGRVHNITTSIIGTPKREEKECWAIVENDELFTSGRMGHSTWYHKWGRQNDPRDWTEKTKNIKPLVSTPIMYPYFEYDIETRSEQWITLNPRGRTADIL